MNIQKIMVVGSGFMGSGIALILIQAGYAVVLNDISAVARTPHDGYRDVKWRPSLTLEKLVQSGDLGRKTGKGWYDYTSGEKKPRTDADL